MKNPLRKRFLRELRADIGKYTVIFIFITGMIGIISGFLVSGESIKAAYDESFEKYNIEDGNFEFAQPVPDLLSTDFDNVKIYENLYIEKKASEFESILRIFRPRDEVNKVCIMAGRLPLTADEIAIDRVYAQNNKISVGDTLFIEEKPLTVSGFVALSAYSTLYQNPSDMMFDSIKFGVGIMTNEGFDSINDNIHYCYSWKYVTPPANEVQEKEFAEKLGSSLLQYGQVISFIPRYANQAILFAGEDIGNDTLMMTVFLYIMIVIIAFIFAITINSTIAKESAVIGTLRATGYTKREIIAHYLMMPLSVTLVSAVTGNILGYTVFKQYAADLLYDSFSLTTYKTLWNPTAFVKTTIVPLVIIFIIVLLALIRKLRLSPLQFLRRSISSGKKKRVINLPSRLAFITRFRIRIILQNLPNYITIFAGILLANVILLVGMGMRPLLDNYHKEITENMIADYQYVLKAPAETECPDAEKFSAFTLKTIEGTLPSEDVVIYGVSENSQYISQDLSDKIYISNAFAQKHNVGKGSAITLKESVGSKEYSFKIDGVYYYPAALAVFTSNEKFTQIFDLPDTYFSGYLSSSEITDIDSRIIASKITVDDMTKTSRQLEVSLGGIADMITVFGVIVFMMIIYLLSKIIIERNAQSISMAKILGYTNREISRLYVTATTASVIFSLTATVPIADYLVEKALKIGFSAYSGYLPYYISFDVYIKMILLGICSYAVIAIALMKKINNVPFTDALKNAE